MSKFVNLPTEILNIETKEINQSRLDLDIEDFYNNDIILIKSITGTGKTRYIGKIANKLKAKYNCNFLSVVNLITLSREQISTFSEESGLILNDYQHDISKLEQSDGVICINSLYKLSQLKKFDISNTILYIDEVNDLVRNLTHNESLDSVSTLVYTFLIKLIKGCKKIIFSDATINKNTMNLLSSRTTNNKSFLIHNLNKKYTGTKAIKYNIEKDFLNKLRECINNKKYFLFGCCGCDEITKFFKLLIDEYPEQKKDFILITSKTKFRPENASEDFKNKYVFYSPSITTGVSFVLKDVKQPQFIYITSNPKITPTAIYQMSSRTRNMSDLHYFCNEIKATEQQYETIKEVENKYKRMIKLNNRLMGLSKSVDENDEIKIVDNSFFKMFCYEEWLDGIFKTGFLEHYEKLLSDCGFDLEEIGTEHKTLEKEEKQLIKEMFKKMNNDEFNAFKIAKFKDIETEAEAIIQEENLKAMPHINSRCNLLNIQNEADADEYKTFLTDEHSLRHYYSFLSLFRTKEYIKEKQIEKNKDCFIVKNLSNTYSKVNLLFLFEKHYNIERLNFDFTNVDETNEINDKFKEYYKDVFPKQTAKNFKTKYDLLKVYVNMIKNICGEIPIIKGVKQKKDKKLFYAYELNKGYNDDITIKYLLKLTKLNNPSYKHFDIHLIERITGLKPDKLKTKILGDDDLDEDKKLDKHIFSKTFKK